MNKPNLKAARELVSRLDNHQLVLLVKSIIGSATKSLGAVLGDLSRCNLNPYELVALVGPEASGKKQKEWLNRSVCERLLAADLVVAQGDGYGIADSHNWADVDAALTNDPPGACIQVEYDLEYSGGDYSDTGDFAYVPCSLADRLGSIEAAFERHTGHSRIHIVHYSPDELYTADGEPLEDK
jgi:hypothetical protein